MLIAATVSVAEPVMAGELTELAVTVTARSVGGGAAGAVYVTVVPLAEVEGETFPQPLAPHCTVHVTPLFV
jgi:hypothetical protein